MSLKFKNLVALAGVAAFTASAFVAVNGAKATMAGGFPFFLEPFDGVTVIIITQPGVPVSQKIHVSDFDLPQGDVLKLEWNNQPPGSITTPPLPIIGAPGAEIITIWSWTPTNGDVGNWTAHFVVSDSDGQFKKADIKIEVEPPFAVELGAFEVSQDEAGAPGSVRWTTLSEIDNAYFNIYRGNSVIFEQASKANGTPYIAVGNPFEGFEYEHVDLRVKPGSAYRYWLEAVDIFGESQIFGPVTLYAR
jgi:hypothetical protein